MKLTLEDCVVHPLITELQERGLLGESTDLAALDARLHEGSMKVYVGFDPTAASLHVGSLMPLFVARMFRRHGHVPVLLLGGATGMIGDPSGRSDERNMLSDATLDTNRAGLRAQMERLVADAGEAGDLEVVDNREWLGTVGLLDFLRDVGRHFRVGDMLARDSVRNRLDADSGLSFTELSYQLLQAFDFWWLHEHRGVEAQIGGSDQWGNITAGIDFMRRRSGAHGLALVWPLLTKADGSKFGKSQGGNVWLDAELTRPLDFWQFWFNTDDADVEAMLLRFSERPVDDLRSVVRDHARDPGRRRAQRVLADAVTGWVHGPEAAARAAAASQLLFSDDELAPEQVALIAAEAGAFDLPRGALIGRPVVQLAVDVGLCDSLGEARRLAAGGGMRVGRRAVAPDDEIKVDDLGDTGSLRLHKGTPSRDPGTCSSRHAAMTTQC